MSPGDGSFELSGVVHLVRPAGQEVHDLEELRLALTRASDRALFFHTAARLLRRPDCEELPPDDLSAWVGGVVQDRETAERMSYAVESCENSAEGLRAALLGVLDSVPEKQRIARDAPLGGEFVFLTADSVLVPTGERASDASELIELLAAADAGVWFFHLIEEPWFEPGSGPLVQWVKRHGKPRLAEWLEQIARSGRPLERMRERALRLWRLNRLGERIAAASLSTEGERREAGREAVSKLVRRISRSGEDT
jgi:hypothetical protein